MLTGVTWAFKQQEEAGGADSNAACIYCTVTPSQ